MDLTAKLVQILPLQKGTGKSGNEWRKQDIIIETSGQYPKKVCISVWGDKINEKVLQLGSTLNIAFDLESREFNGRWYTDVKAWKVEPAGATSTASNNSSYTDVMPADADHSDTNDDLPF